MLTAHAGGVRNAIALGDKVRVQTTFDDKTELVEEFHAETHRLLCRRWRSPDTLGRVSPWEYEIGDPPKAESSGNLMMRASASTPTFHPRDSGQSWEWHIRNLPYPVETYLLSVNANEQRVVLRTTNKKYFNKWAVPALVRAGMELEEGRLSRVHSGSTLVVSYSKPCAILEAERAAYEGDLRANGAANGGGHAPECQQS